MLIAPEDPGSETIRVPVLKVFDGDGFLTRIDNPRRRASFEVTIRLGFIDAPEMEQPGGIEARDFLQSLIGGRHVDLAILMKMDTGGVVDRHKRIVAVPYLQMDESSEAGGPASRLGQFFRGLTAPSHRNIELEMILNGWAWVLDRYGPDECYFEALDDAQRNRRGIWANDDNVHPWEFKKQRYRARRAKPKPAPQAPLFDVPEAAMLCPMEGCDGQLVEKSGRFGSFLGCSNFPRCRHSRNLNG